jgi:hypothetical protein
MYQAKSLASHAPAVTALQDTLDETLPDTIHMSLIYFMILCTSLAIVIVSIYYYAALTAALFAAFAVMQVRWRDAAQGCVAWKHL